MTYPDLVRDDLNVAISNAVRKYRQKPFQQSGGKQSRKRIATQEDIVRALLLMDGGRLDKELIKAGLPMTASAFSQRRKAINPDIFLEILREFNEKYPTSMTYRGLKIVAIDGTTVNLSRNKGAPSFVCHAGAPEGFNQFHVVPIYDTLSKRYLNVETQPEPKKDEIGALLELLLWHNFEKNTLIVGDRAFGTYNAIATFQQISTNVHFLLRLKHGAGAMREVAKLPMMPLDKEISFTLSTTQTAVDKANNHVLIQKSGHIKKTGESANVHRWDWESPYFMQFRVVRILLPSGEYETLATSLPPSFTPDDIRELYHARWGIETAFRELKYNYNLINVHGKSDKFVQQEINAALLMATVCSTIANEVILRQPQSGTYTYSIDRSMAAFLVKNFLRTPGADGAKLMEDIARYLVPVRPGRGDTRNIRVKGFTGFVYRVPA